MSSFSGLNTASTALWAAQRAMDVTGQNVANANTDGYSRQRVNFQSVGGSVTPAMFSTSTGIGQGVNADDVQRVRDAFLEARAQSEHASTANLTVQSTNLSQIEQAFGEPGENGIQSMLSNMWAGWGDVATANDPGARAQLLQRSATLVAGLHTASNSLTGMWSQSHDALSALVSDVNASLVSIGKYNDAITRADQAGIPSNDLADKRDALVLKLSDQIGATSTPAADGSLTVSLNGTTLVTGNSPLQLQVTGSTDPTTAKTDPPQIVTVPGGTALRAGGTAQGQLTTMGSLVPDYLDQLNAIAQQLTTQVNTAHANGYDLYGNKGVPMFDDGNGNTTGVTAANISLAISDPKQIAAASVDPATIGGQVSADNGNADAMAQLALQTNGTDTTYRQMIVTLGVQSTTASSNLTAQSAISTQVDASRESVSGVNIDDEMANMLQYQHAYAAAGQLVSTINSMLDVVINMVGR